MKMLKLIILVALVLFSFNIFAEPIITDLDKGDRAPFAGTLINDEAAAKMIADKEAIAAKCELDKQQIAEEKDLEIDLVTDLLTTDLEAERQKLDYLMSQYEENTIELEKTMAKYAEESNDWDDAWWYVAGVGTALIVGGVTIWVIQ